MNWVRLWHDMPNDPKWRTIARKSGQGITAVISVYVHMMVVASANAQRGTIDGWDDEDVAVALDLEESSVKDIRKAMEGKVLDGDQLTGWAARQSQNDASTDVNGVYVYVLVATGSNAYKIGVSRNPWARAKDLQTGSSRPIELVAKFKGVRSDERDLHHALSAFRQKGEWFHLPDSIANKLIDCSEDKAAANEVSVTIKDFLSSYDEVPVATVDYEDKSREDKSKDNPPSSDDDSPGQKVESKPKAPEPEYQAIVTLYNELLGDFLPEVVKINTKRKSLMRARWKETFGENSRGNDLNFWRRYFLHVRRSKPLTGTKDGFNWSPGFDWLLNESNMTRVVEGEFHQGDDRRSDLQEAS